MANTQPQRKKGKKRNKGTVVSLQSFLSNGDTPVGTTTVSKKIKDFDGDDSDDGSSSFAQVYELPTAPRASRDFDDSVPHKPPFTAYVTNLPFDANEDDIHDFFGAIPIISLRLPREDGETGRVRGFANVEFDSRDDLVNVLNLPDPSIKGRRIRIELSNEHEKQSNRQRDNRRGFDGFGNTDENRESTNWRSGNKNQESGGGGGGGYGKNYERDRGFNRERNPVSEESSAPGSWRSAGRSFASNLSPQRGAQGDDGQRDFDRYRSRPIGSSYRNEDDSSTQERPKLNLKPRTLPLPEIIKEAEDHGTDAADEDLTATINPLKSGGISPEKVFGSAKPVDTAARELEIEERLAEARRHVVEASPQRGDRGNDRQREVDRYRSRPIGSSYRNEDDSSTQERPKLNLKPRTLPLPEIIKEAEEHGTDSADEDLTATTNPLKSGGISPEKVFGSAKPVDTAARELQIEERLAEARRQEKKQADVNEHEEINTQKNNKENTSSASSWRRRDDTRKYSTDRNGLSRQDDRRFNKNRESSDRSELPKSQPQQRKDSKTKRDVKTDRAMPQYKPTKSPGLQSSNKYSGLDDEASD